MSGASAATTSSRHTSRARCQTAPRSMASRTFRTTRRGGSRSRSQAAPPQRLTVQSGTGEDFDLDRLGIVAIPGRHARSALDRRLRRRCLRARARSDERSHHLWRGPLRARHRERRRSRRCRRQARDRPQLRVLAFVRVRSEVELPAGTARKSALRRGGSGRTAVRTVKPFRFALQAVPRGSRSEWQDLARKAEALGYSTLQVPDHLGIVDPFSPLVSAADVTTTLRVGQLVINNALHHPVLLARQAATVDMLTDGRLELGLGTGWAQAEHDASGIPCRRRPCGSIGSRRRSGSSSPCSRPEQPARRARTGSRSTTSVWRASRSPRPPILIGGFRPRVLAIAARHAEIVQLTGLTLDGHGGVKFGDASRATAVAQARQVTVAAGGAIPSCRSSSSVSTSTTRRRRSPRPAT